MDNTYNIIEAVKAQKEYCETNKAPHFAPTTGNCWSCGRNIYSPIKHGSANNREYTTGVSVEKAGKELVTGCPHCNRSYCD